MAENKISFLFYCDYIGVFEQLSDREAGQLIKHILRYVNDKNPETESRIIGMAFEPIKLQLKRDLKKWERYIEKQSENGKLGGRPKKPKKTQTTQALIKKPKKADTVTVLVTDTVTKRERAFAPPAQEDVVNEMMLKLDDFTAMGQAERFMNHYESKGWLVGKTKMKDWKASVRGWITRMGEFKKPVIEMKQERDQSYRYEKL